MNKKDIVFSEINEHMRNTENKYLTISTSYIGLIAVVISLIYSNKNNSIIDYKSQTIIIYSSISIIGCLVYIIQKWYRMWKEHYLDIAQEIISEWEIKNEFLPYWLRKKQENNGLSFDHILGYFTWNINLITIVILALNISDSFKYYFLNISIPILLVLLFVLFTYLINKRINKNKIHIA